MTTACQICVERMFVSPGHNFFGRHGKPAGAHDLIERVEITCVAGRGIAGDRFFDHKENYKGQITFFSMEVFEAFRRELNLPQASPETTRRNVFVRGPDLARWIGEEFEIQGVRFAGMEECRPCYWMNHAFGSDQAETWLKGKGGLRARILTTGTLHRGL